MSPPPPSSSPPGQPSIPLSRTLDAGALARLRELDPDGRHGVVRRVLQAFDTSLVRMLDQVNAERGTGSTSVLTLVAHTLKSSAGSVGALQLAEACTEVEKVLRDTAEGGPPGHGVDAQIEHLHREGEAALQAVRAMLRT